MEEGSARDVRDGRPHLLAGVDHVHAEGVYRVAPNVISERGVKPVDLGRTSVVVAAVKNNKGKKDKQKNKAERKKTRLPPKETLPYL